MPECAQHSMSNHGSSNSHGGESPGEKLRAVEDLKKLSPEERIKRLKELEEERKKEIEEAESLIKETVREIEEAKEKRIIPIPEARATDLATLDTAEERQLVATHHFLTSETAAATTPQSQQQKKSLEEVAAEEAPAAQQQAQLTPQQMQGFRRPDYGLGSGQQSSGLAGYVSQSQQTATQPGLNSDGSPMEEKVRDFYKERADAGAEIGGPQEKYFGSHGPASDSYQSRKAEHKQREEQSDFYRRRAGGPA